MTEYQEDIRDALRRMYGLDFTYLWTEHVRGDFFGKPWDGVVEVFAVHGHETAIHTYAWSVQEDNSIKYAAALGIGPVVSAYKAVEAILANEII